MEDCLFCKLVNGQMSSLKVYEDQNSIAFMELNPSSPGHLMVILKKHGKTVQDYSQDELGMLFSTVSKVSQKIEKAMNPNSITIGINHKEKRGVPHLHVHLIPRWENDKGGIIQSVVNNKPKETREEIAEKIKKA